MVRDDDGASDDGSGWRACELCWKRAVGREDYVSAAPKSFLAVGVSAVAYVLWQILASAR